MGRSTRYPKIAADILESLSSEFSRNYQLISCYEEECTAQCRAEKTADQLYERIHAALAAGRTSIEAPEILARDVLATPTLEVETPVLDGVVRSGQLALIRDQDVLSAIAEWDRYVRNTVELQLRSRFNAETHMIPELARRADIGHLVRDQFLMVEIESAGAQKFTTLEVDRAFKAVIAQRYENIARANRSMHRARKSAQEVLERLEIAGRQ